MSDADLAFLPWLRRGASRALQGPGATPGATTVAVTINDHDPLSLPVRVMGPGHVTGLDQRQVIRTDPTPGSGTFETNFFPLIEFDEPSLPWLFTPTPGNADTSQLAPWLCLVVVRRQAGIALNPPGAGGLPILRFERAALAKDELPDLTTSWAWAHAQMISLQTGGDQGKLINDLMEWPERSLSRLICPRKLDPETDYVACVVPTFERGRRTGLGLSIDTAGDPLAPAWSPMSLGAETPFELPVYYSWEFRTAPGGDFRSLAMLLHAAQPIPQGLGVAQIDVGDSGLKDAAPDGTRIPLQGALRPHSVGVAGWPDDGLRLAWEARLTPVLNAASGVSDDEDPLLAPPLYGAAQGGFNAIDHQKAGRWFEQLNLSPAHRATARLGASVVAANQDALMASAWAQAAELERANQLIRQGQFGARLAESLHRRHIARMDPAAGLQVFAPARVRLLNMRNAAGGVGDLRALFAATNLAPANLNTTLRKIARPRGPIYRRAASTTGPAAEVRKPVAFLENFTLTRAMPRVAAWIGPLSFERVAANLDPSPGTVAWAEATDTRVNAAPPAPDFAFVPLGTPVAVTKRPPHPHHPFPHAPPHPAPLPPPHPPHHGPFEPADIPIDPEMAPIELADAAQDSAAARQFQDLAAAHLRVFNPQVPQSPPLPLFVISIEAIALAFSQAVVVLRPAQTFALRMRALVEVAGPPRDDGAALTTLRLAPHFPQPMVEPLSEIAANLVLPGLDRVPPNTVLPLETNPAFIESFMAGLNHEMGRELLWRGFPADLRATYFDRFWRSLFPISSPDIAEIKSWGERPLTTEAKASDLVLLVRSELLRRYPDAIVSAVNGATREEKLPIFTGGFPPDVRYIGFDIPAAEASAWSIVIKEHPSSPRFGERSDHSFDGAYLTPPAPDSGLVAESARMRPVRITLPPSVLAQA